MRLGSSRERSVTGPYLDAPARRPSVALARGSGLRLPAGRKPLVDSIPHCRPAWRAVEAAAGRGSAGRGYWVEAAVRLGRPDFAAGPRTRNTAALGETATSRRRWSRKRRHLPRRQTARRLQRRGQPGWNGMQRCQTAADGHSASLTVGGLGERVVGDGVGCGSHGFRCRGGWQRRQGWRCRGVAGGIGGARVHCYTAEYM